MAKVFSNEMVAHVWAQGTQDAGRSHNGQFYFNGRTLYSYGPHYVAGYLMPDGTALINDDSNSNTTNRHTAMASNAARGAWARMPDLDDWQHVLPEMDGKRVRDMLAKHALALIPHNVQGRWNGSTFPLREELGAYLARVAGLPKTAWPSIKRHAAEADAKAKRAAEKANKRRDLARAVDFATMPDKDWRETLAMSHARYKPYFDGLSTKLYHAVRLAKVEGFSAKRRAVLSHRRKDALWAKDNYVERYRIFMGRRGVRTDIGYLRSAQRLLTQAEPAPLATRINAVNTAVSSLRNLVACEAFPMATRNRMHLQAARLRLAVVAMDAELTAQRDAEQAERIRLRNLAAAERKAAWLAGSRVDGSFDADCGGAALRIVGDTLETSHGAEVPLDHAIKAFRFVKMIRDRGEAWQRNGKTIRVGHFQIDRIDPDGNFIAGCHTIKWPEIERVAKLAGVFDIAADDSALVGSN